MSKRWKLSSLLAIMLVASLVLSACNFGGGQGSTGPADTKTLNLTDTAEPKTLDYAKNVDQAQGHIILNVMEGLMRLDANHQPVPAIAAEMPKISEDKLTYTFKLRDAKWSDGKPVTAHDFEYGWKRVVDPATQSQYSYIFDPVLNANEIMAGKKKPDELGVKALDDKTLEVKLRAPTPYFLDLCAFSTFLPQRKDIVEKYGKDYFLEADKAVYNGPFVLAEWKHDQSWTLKKNPNYYDKDKVKLETVKTQIVKEAASAVNLYKTNKVDFAEISQEFADAYKNSPEKFVIKESTVFYLEFNHKNKLFSNKKIRQAINLAVDRKTLTELLKNGSIPAGGVVPPDIKAIGEKKFREVSPDNVPQVNSQEAKKLWEEGLKELGMTAPAKIELLGDNRDTSKKQMEFIKDQLRTNLGINVEIAAVPFKERLARGEEGRFELLLSGWGADYNDAMTFLDLFTTGNAQNHGKWSNADFDNLIAKSKSNPNFEERAQDLVKAENIMKDDVALVPLYYRTRLALVKPYVKGMIWHAVGAELDLKNAYIEQK